MDLELQIHPGVGLSLKPDCATPVGLALRLPKMLINVNKKTLRVAANETGEFWITLLA